MSFDETPVVWREEYRLGVEHLDRDHHELIDVLRWMLTMARNDTIDPFTAAEGVIYFTNYVSRHFSNEEEYMRSIHYKDYEAHKKLHDKAAQESLPPMLKALEESNYSADTMRDFLGFWSSWLSGHILVEDLKIRQAQEK